MKIAVSGTGYVGLSNAMLLAANNKVVAVDIVPDKVGQLNHLQSPIVGAEMPQYLTCKDINFRFTRYKREAYKGADFIAIRR